MEAAWVILFVALAIGLRFYVRSPTVIGAQGERRVSTALRRTLDKQSAITLDNLTLPTKRGTTQIDHVVLSKHGVFVIETKNMSGWIFGGERQARWTQTMRGHKSQFQNPLRQNYQHVKVVQELLAIEGDQIENLVAFVGSAVPKTEMPGNVFWNRQSLLEYLRSKQIVHFSDLEVRDFAHALRAASLEDSKATLRAHVRNLRTQAANKSADTSSCPRCGANLVERRNKNTGSKFLGCSTFPKCRGVRQVQ